MFTTTISLLHDYLTHQISGEFEVISYDTDSDTNNTTVKYRREGELPETTSINILDYMTFIYNKIEDKLMWGR